jgi:hypothetical protein
VFRIEKIGRDESGNDQCYVSRTYYDSENKEQDFPTIIALLYVALEWALE